MGGLKKCNKISGYECASESLLSVGAAKAAFSQECVCVREKECERERGKEG